MIENLKAKDILNSLAVGVIIFKENRKIIYINKKVREITGYSLNTIKSVDQWFQAAHPDPVKRKKIKDNFNKIINQNKNYNNISKIVDKNKQEKYLEIQAKPISNNCFLVNIFDISDKYIRKKEIEYLSFHDRLTGLYNRHYLQNELKRLENSRKYPVSIIIGDLDNLKTINDNFGHLEGDKCIKKTATILKSLLRDEDIIARVGGDEFIILLSNTPKEEVLKITKRIKNEFNKYNNKIKKPINFSLSLGFSTTNNKNKGLMDCYDKADKNMYKNKKNNIKER